LADAAPTWGFGEQYSDYPGFDELAGDLEHRLEQLGHCVTEETGQSVSPVGSECVYLNEFEEIPFEQMASGVLTRWKRPGLELHPLNTDHGGLRLHFGSERNPDSCPVTLRVSEDDQRSQMNLEATRDLDHGEALPMGGLLSGHNQLTQTFLSYTSESMRREWGRE